MKWMERIPFRRSSERSFPYNHNTTNTMNENDPDENDQCDALPHSDMLAVPSGAAIVPPTHTASDEYDDEDEDSSPRKECGGTGGVTANENHNTDNNDEHDDTDNDSFLPPVPVEQDAATSSFSPMTSSIQRRYEQQQQRKRCLWLFLAIATVLSIIAISVGSACGKGRCRKNRTMDSDRSTSSSASQADASGRPTAAPSMAPSSSLAPTTVEVQEARNRHCEGAVGPVRIGGPSLAGEWSRDSENSVGRWYTVTGGGEVIRASTCVGANRTIAMGDSSNSSSGTTNTSTTDVTGARQQQQRDTKLSVYTSCNFDAGHAMADAQTDLVVSNDQFCGAQSSVSWLAVKNVTYYILVSAGEGSTDDGKDNNNNDDIIVPNLNSNGKVIPTLIDSNPTTSTAATMKAATSATSITSVLFDLTVDYEHNGDCTTRIGPLPTDGTLTVGSMRGAGTITYFTCDFNLARQQTWYSVRGTGGLLLASTCNPGTDFAARLGVFVDGCGTAGSCAAVRDSDCAGPGSQIVWESERDVEYILLVYKSSGKAQLNYELSIEALDGGSDGSGKGIPDNDACVNAQPILADGTMVMGDTRRATVDSDPTSSLGVLPFCPDEVKQPGVWYTVTGTGEPLLASTCHNTTAMSTEVSVFASRSDIETDKAAACGQLECVYSESQYCNEKGAVFFDSVRGETYYILVHGAEYVGLFPTVGTFALTVEPFETAPNNECTSALLMEPSSTADAMMTGSTFDATLDTILPRCAPFASVAPGLWYTVVGTGGSLRASTCDPSTDYDTQITVYTGGACDSLRCVITDDNACGVQSSVTWSAMDGELYHVLVHGRAESSVGNFALLVQEYEPLVANDFCDAAIDLTKRLESKPATTTRSMNGTLVLGSTVGATFDNAPTCAGVPASSAGVWYSVEGTGTRLSASLCHDDDAATTNFDTALSVFVGDCVSYECVTANADGTAPFCGGAASQVSWISQPSRTYYLLVHGFSNRVGDFGLLLDEPVPAVSNDYCVAAIPLELSETAVVASTVGATIDDTPVCSDVVQNGPGVWYTVSGTGERLEASTCNNGGGNAAPPLTTFDTKITIFRGSCGALECVLADDNFCGTQSRLVWLTEKDVEYYILVHGPSMGSFGLVVDPFVPATTNDFCSAAQGPLLPTGETVTGSTVDSSFDEVGECGPSNTSPGVWFFVVGTGERLTADTCNYNGTSFTDFDTKLSIFTGRNCGEKVCVTGNDDGCGLQSSISWDSEIGAFYWILLHGWETYGVGNYGLKISGSELFQS